jgi:acylphosphatase
MKSLRIKISGDVQGVGYRYFAKRLADRLGVKGYVRNLRDGSVEVLAQCPDEASERQFLTGLEEGPLYSIVTGVDCTEEDYPREFEGFEITF